MIYPIVAYGDPVLKKKASPIDKDFEGLSQLIEDMYETMENAHGVGLAAPQIGKAIRIFIVDASPFAEEGEPDYEVLKDFKKTFINAQIIEEVGEPWAFNEGCLSIPEIREDVFRKPKVTIRYFDENFNEFNETFEGLPARIIQHEYDHIEGILFTDRLSTLRKRLLKGKLSNISKGKIVADYRMRFPLK
ncbi:MAG: peptide deformylase [Schleiferiaceae bacterium]|nr:peptide deformylase [Schleiferiaceae bacterium]